MLNFVIIILAITISLAMILFCRQYVKRTFSAIDAILNRFEDKNLSVIQATTRDSRISKLENQANRIINQYLLEMEDTKTKMDSIQSFISDISHQFKTPLAGLLMFSEMLLEEDLTVEEQKEFLGRIKASTQRLQWMTESLINISRLEAGTIELTPQQNQILPTLTEAMHGVSVIAIEKKIRLHLQPFDDQQLHFDSKWTLEALINILENAVKYSPIESEIKITVEPLSMYTKIDITDNGIGIVKSECNLIFKRFYRGTNATKYEGIGLGLYLATLIMEKQGGYIMVKSIPNQYTTFSLFLQNCQK